MSDGSGSSNGGDDSDDDEFFDASRKVVELDGDDDEFSVELFSHDERVQKPSLPSLPDLEADDPRQVRSMRAAFRTTLPIPLKLQGPWQVRVARTCFRNARSCAYRLRFLDQRGVLVYEHELRRAHYETLY